jgi:hypothetical protein
MRDVGVNGGKEREFYEPEIHQRLNLSLRSSELPFSGLGEQQLMRESGKL